MEGERRCMLVFCTLMLWGCSYPTNAQLQYNFYNQFGGNCYLVESTVYNTVYNYVYADKSIGAAMIRILFHDCFVQGCDASVLIASNATNVAEIDAIPNKGSLRNLSVIDAAKAAVEAICPDHVSCADIVALAARDGVWITSNFAEYWSVPLGRRDGVISLASAANVNLPPPFATYPQLVQFFANKGLSEKDMVVLSGAHTIGFTRCVTISPRLYNFTGPGAINGTDPSLNASYAAQLKITCPFGGDPNVRVPLDPTPTLYPNGDQTFDNDYYINVKANRGLFQSDAALLTNATGLSIVNSEANIYSNYPFYSDFAASVVRMSSISVLTGTQGQIRRNCSVVNS